MTDGTYERCHETVDQTTREDVLERDGHRCRTCGACGPGAGGDATLHVHHIERDPDGMDVHAMENLTTLCRQDHSWLHNQPSELDLPVALTEADLNELLPHDREILQVLADTGPATTGDIRTELSADVSVMAVRERLWKLMGLDAEIDERDRQVIDQHVDTGEWGLPDQITGSARGRIPDTPHLVLQRATDERVRRALEAGYDRTVVADIVGVTKRTTYHQEKRARAYQFPLDVIAERTGGRPSVDGETDDEEFASQRPVDKATPQDGERATARPDGCAESSTDGDTAGADPWGAADETSQHIQQAINALRVLEREVSE